VGAICVVLNNYDSKAGLFNGTRVQIIGFVGDNLIRIRILDGRGVHVGMTYLMGRAKFEYGRDPGERGIPFSREQFPLDLGHVLTYNKGQGQTYQRTGLWNFNAQPFADGMFYTGCSRSTSAAGLKIYGFLGVNSDMALNKVDFALLGELPRIADAPTVPPEHPPADPAPLLTPRRSPRVEPMDLTRTPRPSLTEEPMDISVPPTPQTVVSVMDWEDTVPPLPEQPDEDSSAPAQETNGNGSPDQQPPPDTSGVDNPPADAATDSGTAQPRLFRRL
jgi:hypothetical protein